MQQGQKLLQKSGDLAASCGGAGLKTESLLGEAVPEVLRSSPHVEASRWGGNCTNCALIGCLGCLGCLGWQVADAYFPADAGWDASQAPAFPAPMAGAGAELVECHASLGSCLWYIGATTGWLVGWIGPCIGNEGVGWTVLRKWRDGITWDGIWFCASLLHWTEEHNNSLNTWMRNRPIRRSYARDVQEFFWPLASCQSLSRA